MAPDLSVDVRSPGARSGTRQHRKRAELTDAKLQETLEALRRNNWDRKLTARRLLLQRETLNARIRTLKRDGCEIPEDVLPKMNPANKKSCRFSVEELNSAHQILEGNGWNQKVAAEELGLNCGRMHNLIGAMRRLGYKVQEGPLGSSPPADQGTQPQPAIANPGRMMQVLEAIFFPPDAIENPHAVRGMPQLRTVQLGKEQLAALLGIRVASVQKEVVAAFKVLRDSYRRSPDQSFSFDIIKLIRLISSIRHDAGDHLDFRVFLVHVISMSDAWDKVDLCSLLKTPRKSERT